METKEKKEVQLQNIREMTVYAFTTLLLQCKGVNYTSMHFKKVLGGGFNSILFQLNEGYSINKVFEEVINIFKGFIDPSNIVSCENEIGFIF